MCIKISNVIAIQFRSEVYSKVESEPKHEVATTEREFKFRKRMAFSVLVSLRTVPLHSTLAVNNLGLLNKVVYRHMFLLLYQYAA